jgi:hypothetical protein
MRFAAPSPYAVLLDLPRLFEPAPTPPEKDEPDHLGFTLLALP